MRVRWSHDSPCTGIHLSYDPNFADVTLTTAPGDLAEKSWAASALIAQRRAYISLAFADGQRVLAAERILSLEGGLNFRD